MSSQVSQPAKELPQSINKTEMEPTESVIKKLNKKDETEEQGEIIQWPEISCIGKKRPGTMAISPKWEEPGTSNMQLSSMNKEGITAPKTFRVKGKLTSGRRTKDIIILIDCGATHNFISQRVAQTAGVSVHQLPEYKREIGNGDLIRNDGRCEAVSINIQQTNIIQDFYVLELGEIEMVLGLEWLSGLGTVEFNFNQLTIKWRENGRVRKLQGDAHLSRHQVPLKSITAKIQANEEEFCLLKSAMIETEMEKETANPWKKEGFTEIADRFTLEYQCNTIQVDLDFMNQAVERLKRLIEQTVEKHEEKFGKRVVVALYEAACCALASIEYERIKFVPGKMLIQLERQRLGEVLGTWSRSGGYVLSSILPSSGADSKTETYSPEDDYVFFMGDSIRDQTLGRDGDNNCGQKDHYVDTEIEWRSKRRKQYELKYWEGRGARIKHNGIAISYSVTSHLEDKVFVKGGVMIET
ncbi:unnamed protein product [Cuscuta europaea]|uniref:Uncharacterized protein n=1 Tax=Cuscuta europaea TaxID=41803 RepID=A0A9P1DW05_CUSEU|nr:unnamed protein product [Cuscuta europaea]